MYTSIITIIANSAVQSSTRTFFTRLFCSTPRMHSLIRTPYLSIYLASNVSHVWIFCTQQDLDIWTLLFSLPHFFSSGSSSRVRRAEKHEISAVAFDSHLFYDLFSQGQGGHGPLGHPLDPLLLFTYFTTIDLIVSCQFVVTICTTPQIPPNCEPMHSYGPCVSVKPICRLWEEENYWKWPAHQITQHTHTQFEILTWIKNAKPYFNIQCDKIASWGKYKVPQLVFGIP